MLKGGNSLEDTTMKFLKLLIAFLIMVAPLSAQTVTQTYLLSPTGRTATITWSWTAAADGSVTGANLTVSATNLEKIKGWFLYAMETNPGSTAPTDDYDIVVNDADGLDILGGVGANRDTANTEKVLPMIGGTATPVPIDTTSLVLAITNNAVNAATGTVKLCFVR